MAIGHGPFHLNKISKQYQLLGVVEYVEGHSQKELLQKSFPDTTEPTLSEVYENIRKRKHINMDEFELIMISLDIDMYKVNFMSDDMIHEQITSDNPAFIQLFEEVFMATGMEYVRESSNKIILTN